MSQGTPPHFDYGAAAQDYARFRAGFPPRFFEHLIGMGLGKRDQQVVDMGCGTGTLALGFALRGAQVTAVDPAHAMVAMTQQLAQARGLNIRTRLGRAETFTTSPPGADLITCGQCWHWFDRPRAAVQLIKALAPGGALVICHLDWLARPGTPAGVTHGIIESLGIQPDLTFDTVGIYPQWAVDVAQAGFVDTETFSFEWTVPYDIEGWRGRMRASAWADPRLDAALTEALQTCWPDGALQVPHRVWALVTRRPG